ncbi:unconventional prefoldin RPB5 interactor-like protein [Phlebotomus papatasi]|uniref:unconventional prefoldin RPB5 interactor-like protein n=1 Tax=Phlebotomus papatasi TaxID=29031 RepID=UPI002483B4DA|nr:unconventional prefoldin RPB5 interactor-like protein [Phlebotomus papatasi]
MDFLQKNLQEALQKNSEALARWASFRDEQVQAIENLYMYQKHLEVEIMVPIGNKALLPGVLYHTNEVMVTHFSGLQSKCTVQKAHEILHRRVEIANEHVKMLEAERDLMINRQELPFAQEAFSDASQQEILEEYDEEKEKAWREEHKKRMKEHKKREAEERKAGKVEDRDFEELMSRLDELEMIEEINSEFNDEEEENTTIPEAHQEVTEESPPPEPPSQEILQTKRKSLTFSDKDSVHMIKSHEAPCKVIKQPESLELNPDLTLYLEISHSPAVFTPPTNSQSEIASPADIYRLFSHCLESPDQPEACVPKSILKNREAVERETHLPEAATVIRDPIESRRRTREIISVDQSSILGDIKERNPEQKSTAETDSKKIPKRPMSRFKSCREANS